jgi:hypothetical protein
MACIARKSRREKGGGAFRRPEDRPITGFEAFLSRSSDRAWRQHTDQVPPPNYKDPLPKAQEFGSGRPLHFALSRPRCSPKKLGPNVPGHPPQSRPLGRF